MFGHYKEDLESFCKSWRNSFHVRARSFIRKSLKPRCAMWNVAAVTGIKTKYSSGNPTVEKREIPPLLLGILAAIPTINPAPSVQNT